MNCILKRKALAFFLTLSLIAAYIPALNVMASNKLLEDDFESYTVGNNLKNYGYIVWHGVKVGGNDENKYIEMLRSDSGTDSQAAMEFQDEPEARKVIVSLDFMMLQNPSDYDAWIFGVLNDSDRNKAAANIQLLNGTIYDGASADSSNAVRENLKAEKWYNAFLLVDLENDTYKLYSGEYVSEEKSFQSSKAYTKTNIFFNARLKTMEKPLYIDNVLTLEVTNEAFDIALCRARGLVLDSEIGLQNGEYPKTAYNMLKEEYTLINEALMSGDISQEQKEEYTQNLNEEITRFINSKIDETASDGEARYIEFNLPDELAVGSDTAYSRELSALVYDKAKQLVQAPITYELTENYDGVSLNGNTLNIEAGTVGEIKIKATAADIYDYHTFTLTKGKTVQSVKIHSSNGILKVSGSLSSKPYDEVRISVNGDDFALNGILDIDESGNFEWTENIDEETAFQFVTVKIEGEDTVQYQQKIPFYGVGWEEAVLEAFNEIKIEEDVENVVKTYYSGVNIDIYTYNENKSLYDKYIFDAVPYEDFSSLINNINDLTCVLEIQNATAENIKNVINSNLATLAGYGFNRTAFENMGSDKEVIFYSSVMELSFSAENSSISEITQALNEILEKVNLPSTGGTSSNGATENIFFDDYEGYEIGNTLGGGEYGLRQGVEVIGDENNQFLCIKRTEPMQSDEAFGSDNNQYNARVSKEFDNEPAQEVIVALEFMLPENPYNYSAELFGVMSDDGNYYAANIRLERGVLYDGRLSSNTPVVTGIEQGKWYYAFLYLDLVNNKYQLFCGDNASELKDFQGKVVEKTNRLFMVRLRNYDEPLYIDNVEISAIKYSELAVALNHAKSIMYNSEKGYENGQYPETAFNMLENTYNNMSKAAEGSLTEDQEIIYTQAVNDAIEKFKNNRIDENADELKESYIKFNVPEAIGIDDISGGSYPLDADVYDVANNLMDSEVSWSLDSYKEGVSVSGNSLFVNPGVRGDIVLRAECGEIYDMRTITLTDCKSIEKLDIDSRNGIIKVSGNFDALPLESVNIKINGNGINLEGDITVNEDASFSWSQDIDSSVEFGFITVALEGNDMPLYHTSVPFYGERWENAVLEEFNQAESSEEVGNIIQTYYIGTQIELEEYQKYTSAYTERIFNKKPFTEFKALLNKIENLQCIIALYEATRTDVEDVIQTHMQALERNGFEKAAFESFSDEQKTGFYASALAVSIDTNETTVAWIAEKLNEITENIKTSSELKNPSDLNGGSSSSGGGGGSFGGGGGGGTSGGKDYDIELVPSVDIQGDDTAENEDLLSDVTPFDDIYLAQWASDALLYMRKNSIMVGDGKNVRPVDAITRGEFAKILTLAFGLDASENLQNFSDIENAWYKEYAQILSACKIMNGVDNEIFGGEMFITRQMLAVAIDRAITHCKIELYDRNSGIAFKDNDLIADYAKDAVERLSRKGIVQGVGDGYFAPETPVKRAEAAQIIYNVLTGN